MSTETQPDTSAQGVRPARQWLWVAGLLSTGMALAVAELFAGMFLSVPSPIYAIGAVIIDAAPGWLERNAIALLGTADKPALITGIVVVSGFVGAALGVLAGQRLSLAAVGFVIFGALGVAAAAGEPGTNLVITTICVAAAVLAAIALLAALVRRAPPSQPTSGGTLAEAEATQMDMPQRATSGATVPTASRRTFLRFAGGAAVAAGAFSLTGRWLSNRAVVVAARAGVRLPRPANKVNVPTDAELGVAGLTPYVVSNARFYRIDTALRPPLVDPNAWRLRIHGAVVRPYELTYSELLDLSDTEKAITIACVSNEIGDDLVGNAIWQGVPLRTLLDRAGVQPPGTQIVGRAVDGFTAGFPTAIGLSSGALVAVGMNGEPLPVEHGFPARLVVPGLYGYVSATKWLSDIELNSFDDFDGYWIPRGWAKNGPVKTHSRIDVPRRGAPVTPGRQPVAGVAWAPTRGISAVEVRIDDGPWEKARLGAVVNDDTWRQWVFDWDASSGSHRIAVRAIDGEGEPQTAERAPPYPSGATGYHTIDVAVA